MTETALEDALPSGAMKKGRAIVARYVIVPLLDAGLIKLFDLQGDRQAVGPALMSLFQEHAIHPCP